MFCNSYKIKKNYSTIGPWKEVMIIVLLIRSCEKNWLGAECKTEVAEIYFRCFNSRGNGATTSSEGRTCEAIGDLQL